MGGAASARLGAPVQLSAQAPPTPTPSWQPGVPSPRKRMKDSGLRGNRSDQLLVRQRKRFLMFRLIIDQCRACLAAASCRPTLGPRCCGRWRSGGTPGVTVTPHHSPSCRRTAREPALGADAALVRQVRTAAAPGQCPVGGLAGVGRWDPQHRPRAPNAPRCPGLGPGATTAAGDLHLE